MEISNSKLLYLVVYMCVCYSGCCFCDKTH